MATFGPNVGPQVWKNRSFDIIKVLLTTLPYSLKSLGLSDIRQDNKVLEQTLVFGFEVRTHHRMRLSSKMKVFRNSLSIS